MCLSSYPLSCYSPSSPCSSFNIFPLWTFPFIHHCLQSSFSSLCPLPLPFHQRFSLSFYHLSPSNRQHDTSCDVFSSHFCYLSSTFPPGFFAPCLPEIAFFRAVSFWVLCYCRSRPMAHLSWSTMMWHTLNLTGIFKFASPKPVNEHAVLNDIDRPVATHLFNLNAAAVRPAESIIASTLGDLI